MIRKNRTIHNELKSINTQTNDVIIEDFGDTCSIVDINGCTIEPDFDSYEEAEMWAIDNNYNILYGFNI